MIASPTSSACSFCVGFSDVTVYPRARELRVNGNPVEINNCAFEILLLLIEADGQIVSKKDLFRRLWPGTCVGETNLRVHMYKLRRALGDYAKAIRTAPNRGYWLTAPLFQPADSGAAPVPAPRSAELSATHVRPSAGTAVLIIDDDRDTRAALNALLRSLRTRVENHPQFRDCKNASLSVAADHIVLNMRLGNLTDAEQTLPGGNCPRK